MKVEQVEPVNVIFVVMSGIENTYVMRYDKDTWYETIADSDKLIQNPEPYEKEYQKFLSAQSTIEFKMLMRKSLLQSLEVAYK